MPRVVHFEIHTENPEQAVRFYTEVFGWKITKWEGPVDYWLIDTGEEKRGINGGMIRRMGPAPAEGQPVNSYVCTIGVGAIDEALKQILDHGGTIAVPKMQIPNVGWLAYAKDTDGNIFGVIQPDATGM